MPTQPQPQSHGLWEEPKPTALLVLADGTVLEGTGFGATGHAVGEVCFNTAMTGYEEILTDPSYAGQIITFTFPHIGNVGTNERRHRDRQPGGDARRARRRAAHRDHRAVELPRHAPPRSVAQEPRRHRARRHRHPRAHGAHPREGHAECGDRARAVRPFRSRRPQGRGAAMAGPRRHGPRADRDDGAALHLERDAVAVGQRSLRRAGPAGIPRRRHRLRHQAQHSAPARRQWLHGDGRSGAHRRCRHSRAQARRHLPLQRAGRPRRHRRIRRAGDPRADRRGADLRDLPRPPDARRSPSARRR